MFNESLFFLHILLIFFSTLGALKFGRVALSIWVCLQGLFANLFVLKQIVLFGLEVTASDPFAVGAVLGLNLIREFYGSEESKKGAFFCLLSLFVFPLLSKIHLLYEPSSGDKADFAYRILLEPTPRLFIASLIVCAAVQRIDLHLFSRLRTKMKGSSLPFRNFLTLTASQLLDTVLFTFIGLYGTIASVSNVIVLSFFIKMIVIVGLTPLSMMIAKNMKRKELSV